MWLFFPWGVLQVNILPDVIFWNHRLSELPRFIVKTSWISVGALNHDRRVDNLSTELAPNNSHPVFGTNSNPERTGRDPWVSAEHIFVFFLFFCPSTQQPLHSQWSKELLKERHNSKNTGCISVCGAKTQTAGLRYSEQAEHQQKTEWNLIKTPPLQIFTPDCFYCCTSWKYPIRIGLHKKRCVKVASFFNVCFSSRATLTPAQPMQAGWRAPEFSNVPYHLVITW